MLGRFGLARWSAAWLCAACLSFASAAGAQASSDELARRHFESGVAYLHESDYDNALRAFEKSYELSRRPEILLNVATVHERRNDLPAAVKALEKYLAEKPDAEDAATVQARITNLKKRIEEASPPSDKPAESATVAPTASAPPPTPTADEPAPNRVPAYIALSVGGLAAAGAVLTGIFAQSEYDDADQTCGKTQTCTDDELSTGRTMALTSTILTGVAIVGVGLGVTLLVTSSSSKETPARSRAPRVALGVGPRGGGVEASFVF